MIALLQTALSWYNRNVVPIPCKPGTKRPAIPWRRWQTARPPRALVERWFTPPRNLALLTGNPLLVLDFDKLSSYYKWKLDYPDLAETYTVVTPRPGRHVYFHVDKPVSTMHLDDIDVRGTRALVMALPSVHPSGELYQAVEADAELLRVAGLAQVLPGWEDSVKKERPVAHQVSGCNSFLTESCVPGQDLVSRIKRALPILTLLQRWTMPIPSSRNGRWWVMRCPHPGHVDLNPSFWADAKRGICGCFKPSCAATQPGGKAMDVINVWAWLYDINNRRAIQELVSEIA